MRSILLHDAAIKSKSGDIIGRFAGGTVQIKLPINKSKCADLAYLWPATQAFLRLTGRDENEEGEYDLDGRKPYRFNTSDGVPYMKVILDYIKFDFSFDGNKEEVDRFVDDLMKFYP